MKNIIVSLVLAMFLVAPSVYAVRVYKWTDDSGTHYSDRRPATAAPTGSRSGRLRANIANDARSPQSTSSGTQGSGTAPVRTVARETNPGQTATSSGSGGGDFGGSGSGTTSADGLARQGPDQVAAAPGAPEQSNENGSVDSASNGKISAREAENPISGGESNGTSAGGSDSSKQKDVVTTFDSGIAVIDIKVQSPESESKSPSTSTDGSTGNGAPETHTVATSPSAGSATPTPSAVNGSDSTSAAKAALAFADKCIKPGVVKCVGFQKQSEIDAAWHDFGNDTPPTLLPIYDASVGGARLSFWANSKSDLGQLHVKIPAQTGGKLWVQFQLRIEKRFLTFPFERTDNSKIMRLAGSTGGKCMEDAITQKIIINRPNYYLNTVCGYKDQGFEIRGFTADKMLDYQPGGDTLCRRDDWKNGRWSHPDCWQYSGDNWMTFMTALDFGNGRIEAWAKKDGENIIKTHDAPLAWPANGSIDIVKLMINSSPHEGEPNHPTFYWWYRNLLVSRQSVDM